MLDKMINKNNVLYARKSYTLGDCFYWKVLVRFKGDKKETCIARVFTENEADEIMGDLIR